MNYEDKMNEYRKICNQILQQEALVGNLEKNLSNAQTELNHLYQEQSEIFSEMEEASK